MVNKADILISGYVGIQTTYFNSPTSHLFSYMVSYGDYYLAVEGKRRFTIIWLLGSSDWCCFHLSLHCSQTSSNTSSWCFSELFSCWLFVPIPFPAANRCLPSIDNKVVDQLTISLLGMNGLECSTSLCSCVVIFSQRFLKRSSPNAKLQRDLIHDFQSHQTPGYAETDRNLRSMSMMQTCKFYVRYLYRHRREASDTRGMVLLTSIE